MAAVAVLAHLAEAEAVLAEEADRVQQALQAPHQRTLLLPFLRH